MSFSDLYIHPHTHPCVYGGKRSIKLSLPAEKCKALHWPLQAGASGHNIGASLFNILSCSVSTGKILLCMCGDHMLVLPSVECERRSCESSGLPRDSPSVTRTHMIDAESSRLIKVLLAARPSIHRSRSRSKSDSFIRGSGSMRTGVVFAQLCDMIERFLAFLTGLSSDILLLHQHVAQLPFYVLKRRYMFVQLWQTPIINVATQARSLSMLHNASVCKYSVPRPKQ